MAPVNISMSKSSTLQDSAFVRGSDRIGSVIHIKADKATPGEVLQTITIEPALTQRMAQLAAAYQKVNYIKLHFTILPQFSTATAGGYCVGFIRDPADKLPTDGTAVNYLITNAGAKIQSWWNKSSMSFNNLGKYFTDKPENGADSWRLYSPGTFAVVCDTPPTQDGYLTIQLDWEVHFSLATLNTGVNGQPVNLPTQVLLPNPMDSTGAQKAESGLLHYILSDGSQEAIDSDVLKDLNPGMNFAMGDIIQLPFEVTTVLRTSTLDMNFKTNYAMIAADGLRIALYNGGQSKIQIPGMATWTSTPPITNIHPLCPPSYHRIEPGNQCVLVDITGAPITPQVYSYIQNTRNPGPF